MPSWISLYANLGVEEHLTTCRVQSFESGSRATDHRDLQGPCKLPNILPKDELFRVPTNKQKFNME